MSTVITRLGIVGAAFGALAWLGSPAWAVTDTAFTYSPAKTGYLSVSTMDFAPDSTGTATGTFYNHWAGNYITANGGCLNTGVNLPNGAKITALTYMHKGQIYLNFLSTSVSGLGSTSIVVETAPVAAARSVRTVNVDPAVTVSNAANMYGIGVCIDAGEEFHGARITYTYTSAGD